MKNNLRCSHTPSHKNTHSQTHIHTFAVAVCLGESESQEKLKLFHALLPVLVLPLYQPLTMMALGLYTLEHSQTVVG